MAPRLRRHERHERWRGNARDGRAAADGCRRGSRENRRRIVGPIVHDRFGVAEQAEHHAVAACAGSSVEHVDDWINVDLRFGGIVVRKRRALHVLRPEEQGPCCVQRQEFGEHRRDVPRRAQPQVVRLSERNHERGCTATHRDRRAVAGSRGDGDARFRPRDLPG